MVIITVIKSLNSTNLINNDELFIKKLYEKKMKLRKQKLTEGQSDFFMCLITSSN